MNELRIALSDYARRAADVLSAAYPDAESILWKGSAVKPWDGPYDFIPGLSDLDLHVYRPGGLENVWEVRRQLFDSVGSPPGDTMLQLIVVNSLELPEEWTLLEGTYQVLVGEKPPSVPSTEGEMRDRDKRDIERLADHASDIRRGVIDRSDAELWPYLRRVRWMFPTVLNRVACVAGHPPEIVWKLNRTGILELTKHDDAVATVRDALIEYLDAAIVAGADMGANPSHSEAALRAGHDLLMEAVDWFHRSPV
ncbi:MAG: hypothetical protein HKN07_02125 [Acidimicrobiia bacterium]|nr:hypothetical protein [Acidimicrobiia bacterium]